MVNHDCHDTNSYIVAEDGRIIGIIEEVIPEKNEVVEKMLANAESMRLKIARDNLSRVAYESYCSKIR